MSKKELLRSLKFLAFSLSAGVGGGGVLSPLKELRGWSYGPSSLTAVVLGGVWNSPFNRRYTFQSANNVPVAMLKVAGFYAVFTPASTWLGNYLAETLLWNEYLVTILNMVMNFVLEYLFDRFVVFRASLDTNDVAKKKAEAK